MNSPERDQGYRGHEEDAGGSSSNLELLRATPSRSPVQAAVSTGSVYGPTARRGGYSIEWGGPGAPGPHAPYLSGSRQDWLVLRIINTYRDNLQAISHNR